LQLSLKEKQFSFQGNQFESQVEGQGLKDVYASEFMAAIEDSESWFLRKT
jgi:hypothetical protein